jgi:hypothetical protein
MPARERLQAQVAEARNDERPHGRAVLRIRERPNRALDRRQPLAVQELAQRRLGRLRVAAVTETGEHVSQEPLRLPTGVKAALRALPAAAVFVVALVVDDRPGGAALVNVASHCSPSLWARASPTSFATSGLSSGNCHSPSGRPSKKKNRQPAVAASSVL